MRPSPSALPPAPPTAPTDGAPRWLAAPRAPRLALLWAGLLGLTTLVVGFFSDDWAHLLILEGAPETRLAPTGPYALFHFAAGDPEQTRALMQQGPFPWWTLPELRLSFLRPLSSALAVLDHRLFGRAPLGWHVHSLLWSLATVACAAALLRRVLPGAAGALAALLFALDEARVFPTAWLANRNALVAVAPALAGLWLHLAWREGTAAGEAGRRPVAGAWALPLSLLLFALGLAGGESALGVLAYVAAYELLAAPGGWRARLLALLPATLLVLAYLGLYKALGHGASGSGAYLDPVGEPLAYLGAAAARLPALLGALLLGAPVDAWPFAAAARPALVASGVLGLLLAAALLRGAWPHLGPDARRHLRWLGAGALLSLLPVASTFPTARLLLVPGLGGAALLAVLLLHAWRVWRQGRSGAPRTWGARGVVAAGLLLAGVHGVLAPLQWPLLSLALRQMEVQSEAWLGALRAEVEPARLPGQRVMVLPGGPAMVGMYMPFLWALHGEGMPRSWWTAALGPEKGATLTRTGADRFELAAGGEPLLQGVFEELFRGPGHPLRAGDRVRLEGLDVEVLEARAQGPTRLRFTFEAPLDDPSLLFLHWSGDAMRPFSPPPVGATVPL